MLLAAMTPAWASSYGDLGSVLVASQLLYLLHPKQTSEPEPQADPL